MNGRSANARVMLLIAVVSGLVLCTYFDEPVARALRDLEARAAKYSTLAVQRHAATAPLAVQVNGSTNDTAAFSQTYQLEPGQMFEYQIVAPRVRSWFDKRVRSFFFNDFWIFFEQLGLIWWGIMGCLFIWAYDPPRRKEIVVFALTSIATGFLVEAIKNTTGKIRPDPFFDGEYPARYAPWLSAWHTKAPVCFPSGHATQAFVTATFFALLYPKARVMLYVAVTFTALSRVVTGAHWLADIYAGALFGYACVHGAFWLWERLRPRLAAALPAGVAAWLAARQLL